MQSLRSRAASTPECTIPPTKSISKFDFNFYPLIETDAVVFRHNLVSSVDGYGRNSCDKNLSSSQILEMVFECVRIRTSQACQAAPEMKLSVSLNHGEV